MMKLQSKKMSLLIIVLVSLQSLSKLCVAQIRNQVFVGTRPLSMGEAFVAVADDGNAIYWNPAGLARMERIQASFAYADLFGLGIKSYYASFLSRVYFIPPLTDYLSFGADWSGISAGDEELEFRRDQFNFSLALQPPKRVPYLRDLSIGVNAKHLKLTGTLDGRLEADASGWGWDVGILYNLGALSYVPDGLNFGLMVHDGGDTQVKHETGLKEDIQLQNIRWGLSYRPFEESLVEKFPISNPVFALDFDDRVHFGLEFWLAHTLAFRAGLQKDLKGEEKITLAFGLGFKAAFKDLPEVNVDYALTDSPVLPNTSKQFGGSLILKDNPRLVRIEEAYINDIFASLYKHYSAKAGDLVRARIRNISQDTLVAEARFIFKPYTKSPIPEIVKLPPGKTVEVPLRVVLDRSILQVTSQERLAAQIEVVYSLPLRGRFRTIKDVDFNLYGSGFLTWDDPGKAAAFVTIGERCVRDFAQQAVQQDSNHLAGETFFTHSMYDAMRVFEMMRAVGFNYVPDPTTPFASVAGKKMAVDGIYYPAEFMLSTSKSGDCDDLSVLLATLLESVGVETALLSVPGHLFMMFNTGLPARRQNSLPVDTSLFVNHRGMLWMPVETTLIQNSFLQAWTVAAGSYREAMADTSLQIVAIADNQQPDRYPPGQVSVPGPCDDLERRVFSSRLASNLAANVKDLTAMMNSHLRKFEDSLRTEPDNLSLRNAYAVVLGQNGERDKARQHLNFVLQKDAHHPAALNNLGNIDFIEGNFDRAESLYVAANQYNIFNKAGTHLNLAFLYEMMIDDTVEASKMTYQPKSIKALTAAGRWLNNDGDLALYLLGLPTPEQPAKGRGQQVERVARDSLEVKQDSLKAVAPQPVQVQPGEIWLKRKARIISNFIKTAMLKLLEGRPIETTVFDRAGAKGRGEVDEDRAWLLWWNT